MARSATTNKDRAGTDASGKKPTGATDLVSAEDFPHPAFDEVLKRHCMHAPADLPALCAQLSELAATAKE